MKKRAILILILLVLFLYPLKLRADIDNRLPSPISFKVEPLHWSFVNTLLPKFSTFTIIDWETGKSFQVQRRAGRNHTDVQPLTSKDTKIMKSLYNGKWSWKRRAILVQTKDYLIAASMHGMPHGAGALQNNFPGHFCIHFNGSTTHRSKRMDFSHKLMILKAAGLVEDYLSKMNIPTFTEAFIESINQQDPYLLNLTLTKGWENDIMLSKWMKTIESIKIKSDFIIETNMEEDALLFKNLSIPVTIYSTINGKDEGYMSLQLIRSSPFEKWSVSYEELKFIPN
ncbi:hypothetical protein ACFSCX_03100 [Bacillus salitolerans]|uniref:Uncharacterized protein n=1 Tax=Bacillus salitolerans TaxID=1437434 RepID=A0ABW4LKA1_9BACI